MAPLPKLQTERLIAYAVSEFADYDNAVKEEARQLAIAAMYQNDSLYQPACDPTRESPGADMECIQLRADDLLRALLTAHAKLGPAVEFAVRRFRDADRAYRQVEANLEDTLASVRALFEDYSGHLARCRQNECTVLADLNVEIVKLQPGSPVNEDDVTIIDQIPTLDPEKANTIAAVHEDLFRYRDGHGLEQMVRGEVDIYVHDPDCEPDDAVLQ